jgi:methionyl aminopeptidase
VIELKAPSQLDLMRQAGQIVGETLRILQEAVRPGISTLELDTLAEKTIRRLGGLPAFKGYKGFPCCICTSVNEEVVHGIPSKRVLKSGDLIGMDVGAIVQGYYGDAAVTVPVDPVDLQLTDLMRVTREALENGLSKVVAGNRLSDISHAVEQVVESGGYSVVRDFVGHGIGTQLHEAPQIPNYGKPGYGPELKVGMVLAIEPMVNLGTPAVRILSDGWTAVTQDGKPSAHFEHTVAVTQDGPEVLTQWQKKKPSK